MTKPTFVPVSILAAVEGWDGPVTDNFDAIKDIFIDNPMPVKEYALAAALPTASNFDRCIVIKEDATAGWLIRFSDGSTWRIVPTQAAAQADSVAASLGALVTDFNSLLAKLRASGALAP